MRKNPDINPFFSTDLGYFRAIFGGMPSAKQPFFENDSAFVQPCDALLGVERPSAKWYRAGNAFYRRKCSENYRNVFGPYPHSQTRPALEDKNIFKVLKHHGVDVHFANAFPRQFFEYIESGQRRLSATTLSCMMSGVPLCTADSLRNGEGISADITAERWHTDLGYADILPMEAFDAGKALRRIVSKHDFTMFEFFLTDKAGHERDKTSAEKVLKTLDEFLAGIMDNRTRDLTLLISSDHGNVEDLSVKTHTLNLSLTAVAGEHVDFFRSKMKSIADVTPAIVRDCSTVIMLVTVSLKLGLRRPAHASFGHPLIFLPPKVIFLFYKWNRRRNETNPNPNSQTGIR